jgi:hypothetical protein
VAKHTLYAYADGADLLDVEAMLRDELVAFVEGRSWSRDTWFVNQRHPREVTHRPTDLPDWDLGLNHELPDPGTEQEGWFVEVEDIAQFLGELAEKSGRSFVIGVADNQTGIADDIHSIKSADVDILRLRDIVGVGSPK